MPTKQHPQKTVFNPKKIDPKRSIKLFLFLVLATTASGCRAEKASKAERLKECRKLIDGQVVKNDVKESPLKPPEVLKTPKPANPPTLSRIRLKRIGPDTKTGVDYDRVGLFYKQNADNYHDFANLDDLNAEKLEKLGYMSGYQKHDTESGIRINNKKLTWTGYNLYTSGHGTVATLMSMTGEVLYEWEYDVSGEVANSVEKRFGAKMGVKFFRRARLFENGDLLVLLDHVGILKLDRDSNKLWFNPEEVHHDFRVVEDGTIYALGEKKESGNALDFDKPIRGNTIVVFDSAGKKIKTVSLLKCFTNTYEKGVVQAILDSGNSIDVFHANSIDVLEKDFTNRHPALKKGNILVSIRSPSVIAVIDIEEEKIALLLKGARGRKWYHQHEAKFLQNGRIIFFDNTGQYRSSRILELEPPTWKVAWSYLGKPPASFHSKLHGAEQRLPNGNTLITESDWGRAFEVTKKGEKVWEFVSPHRAIDDDTLIAVLCDVNRIDKNFPMDWLIKK
jgi:hypothetical protein